jgi:hypothetical protein
MSGRSTWPWLLTALTIAAPALAQPGRSTPKEEGEASPVERAREHARQALELLDAGDHARALDHAQQAEALYHAPVHLEVIGKALEGLGRRAEAADVYERLAAEPLPETSHRLFLEARDFARARLKVLIAELPSLLLEVRGVDPDRAKATLDGRPIALESDVAVRFDPGEYRLQITAPDRRTFDQTIELREGAGVVKVQVTMRREGEAEEAVSIEETGSGSGGLAVPAWVLIGIGGASLVAGAVTGGLTLAQAGELEDRCPDRQCTVADRSDYDSAVTLGWTSTATLALGAALVATGGLLLLLDASDDDEVQALELRVGPAGGSFTYRF